MKAVPLSRRRWFLVGLSSLLVGVGFSWIIGFTSRMTYGSDDLTKGSPTLVNTFPPDLLDTRLMPDSGRKTTVLIDIRGKFLRQPHQKADSLGRSLSMMEMNGNSSSYDELMVMRRVAFYMAELPDEQRPKCMAVKFQKEFDSVLTTFIQQHEMAVCDVPKGLPEQATLVDRGLGASWGYQVSVDNMLMQLIGESSEDIKRLSPPTR